MPGPSLRAVGHAGLAVPQAGAGTRFPVLVQVVVLRSRQVRRTMWRAGPTWSDLVRWRGGAHVSSSAHPVRADRPGEAGSFVSPTPGVGADAGAGAGARQDAGPDGLRLSVAVVARRIGVAPATLRTWDRRYGLGPSGHATGRHRRYAPQDVARLELMQRALVHGATTAEAARYALQAPPDGVPEIRADQDPSKLPPTGGDTGQPEARVRVGGTVLRMPGAGRQARGLARAVLSLDTQAAQRLLVQCTSTSGVLRTWEDVVRPVMGAISERWGYTGAGIEAEHLLSEVVTAVLARTSVDAPPAVSARPVLLGSLPGERHSLPLRALAATLAQRGVATSLVGADLPVDSLVAAIHRTAPGAVFLWAQRAGTADPSAADRLPRTRPRTRCYVGGPGWDPAELPDAVVLLSSLGEADEVLSAAAGM